MEKRGNAFQKIIRTDKESQTEITFDFSDVRMAHLIIFQHFLSASSVTEQVLII